MKKLLKSSGWLAAGALALGLSANAQVTLFDNTTSPSPNQILPGTAGYTAQYGNQVFFGNGYTAVSITSFSFEYYAYGGGPGGTTFAGTPEVQVSWYLNNGPPTSSGYATPGTLVYQSNPFTIPAPASSGSMLTFSGTDFTPSGGTSSYFGAGDSVNVPSGTLTWTVQFGSMQGSDNLGVVLAGAPTVAGSSIGNDYWLYSGGAWTLNQDISSGNPSANDNIAQTWVGTAVPEPSTLVLSLAGGFGLLMAVRRFRK